MSKFNKKELEQYLSHMQQIVDKLDDDLANPAGWGDDIIKHADNLKKELIFIYGYQQLRKDS